MAKTLIAPRERLREALRQALMSHNVEQLERKQKEGYEQLPFTAGEFSNWEDEQIWVD